MPKACLTTPSPEHPPMSISIPNFLSDTKDTKGLETIEDLSLNDEHLFLGRHGTNTSRSRTAVVGCDHTMSLVEFINFFFHMQVTIQYNNESGPMPLTRVCRFCYFSRFYTFADSSRVLTIVISILLIIYGSFR